MGDSLQEFNERRKAGYQKDRQEEAFLLAMNKLLEQREKALYQAYEIQYPFLFVFGLPRSGTTLMSQIIAHSADIAYINNLIARFWLAPVHGIRLSRSVLGDAKKTSFQSDYARTRELTDIHEFGYFWRHLLKKETMADITHVREREADIAWDYVKTVLTNMQHAFDKPMVFKNIFGAYHLKKIKETLKKVIYIYIERDPLDVAVSILEARRKYYHDLNTWWSYAPLEYERLKKLNYWEQIAGQVYFLRRYYRQGISGECAPVALRVEYEELCRNPRKILSEIQEISRTCYGYELKINNPPPPAFPFRAHEKRQEERRTFQQLIEKFTRENE